MTPAPKILGIIPARAGSKRLPGKNLMPLGGKPLICWTIEAARGATRLDRLVVSSDHPEILRIAAEYDPRLPLARPAELAGDKALAIEYVHHALGVLESGGEGPFDIVAILQPTSPLTRAEDIDGTIDLLLASGAESAVSVVQLDYAIHPLKMKVMEGDRLLPYLEEERGQMAAHQLPTIFVRNGSVYATWRGAIDRGQTIGDDCRGYVMPRERSQDINDPIDLELAEFLLARHASR